MPRPGSSRDLDFTDGDTLKRFTITDGDVIASNKIFPTIQKRNTEDADDYGWVYDVNVVKVIDGSFDVLVAAQSGDANAAPGEFPNEVVSLNYRIF